MSKLFHKGLYKEGLKQSFLVGIIFTSILFLVAVFLPVSALVFAGKSLSYTSITIADWEFNPAFLLCFMGYAPMLALNLFSFLNKRNRSDFYHSMPHRRETVFVSYTLSALTWLVGTVLFCSLTTTVIYMFGGAYVTLHFGGILLYLCSIIAASVLVLGATILAMTITGTVFSNIVTALLIIFLPRIILTIFIVSISNLTLIVPDISFGVFGMPEYNIPFSTIFYSYDIDELFANTGAAVYSLVLGLIYLLLAGIAFKARKSEAAGVSAPSRLVQACIRIAVSFVICMIGCVLILENDMGFDADLALSLLLVYGFALIVYFAYEAISTRKLKNVLKALPGLAVLLVLNVAFISSIHIVKNVLLSVNWSGSTISYISMQTGDSYRTSYEEYKRAEVRISEDAVKADAAGILNDMQESIKRGKLRTVRRGNAQEYKIVMQNGKTYYRTLYFTVTQETEFSQKLSDSKVFSEIYGELPQNPAEVTVSALSPSKELVHDLYQTYKEEIKQYNTKPWLYLGDQKNLYIGTGSYVPFSGPEYTMWVSGYYGLQKYESTYYITNNTPKTLQKLIDYTNDTKGERIRQALSQVAATGQLYDGTSISSVELAFYDKAENGNALLLDFSAYNGDGDFDAETYVIDLLLEMFKNPNSKFDLNKPFCVLNFELYDTDGYYEGNYHYFINVDEQLAQQMKTLQQVLAS